ncbi:MAG: alanine--tRNA ligase [Granulosicoccaceae bacterium]
MTTSDIRREFLTFFKKQGHQIVASSPLVPGNDPTLLFTNAGMVQFKELFLGQEKRSYDKATTSQRCVRAGGKHNDLDNVGYTARHHTFFEMLGNFSFGDYFKEQAIAYAWEFLTEVLKLPKDKLWVTVFEEDDEAYDIWAKKVGVPEDRIARIGAKDNFWQMGDTGPCGPCSEIFFDHGPDVWGGPPGTPEEDGDRYIEIWNLVFMQYDRSADGTLTPLPKPSVDTGMGLERIAAVLQGVHSNYEIDLFQKLLAAASDVTGNKDMENASLKVVADHIRSCAFMIVDGVMPSNEGRGYVLRRIIRRAVRHGYNLGQSQAFFHKMVAPLAELMGEAYPELVKQQERVTQVLAQEEARFAETLDKGMKVFEAELADLKGDTVPGDLLFKLYDTYGFPLDLTADIARERSLKVDEAGFEVAMEEQRERARAASNFGAAQSKRIQSDTATDFVGYTESSSTGVVTGLYREGEPLPSLNAGEVGQMVTDVTAFYGESGGQVGDTGRWVSEGVELEVLDTQKSGQAFVHSVQVLQGSVTVGDALNGEIATERRKKTVANHSATHLLHEALRRTLGEHVQQKGSLVTPDYLRFDFSHDHPVTLDQRVEVESWVNEQIRANHPADIREMSMDDAKKTGATMLFGEKYGERVRVVTLGQDSVELCGGTHVSATGDIGFFKLTEEGSVATGVRRIEAVTGQGAVSRVAELETAAATVARRLNTSMNELPTRVDTLIERTRELERTIDQLKAKAAAAAGQSLTDNAVAIGDVKLLATKLEGADPKQLRETVDQIKAKLGESVVVLAMDDGGVARVVAGVSKPLCDRLSANDLIKHLSAQLGGKGGGRPDFAQAGGDAAQLDVAVASVQAWVEERLN